MRKDTRLSPLFRTQSDEATKLLFLPAYIFTPHKPHPSPLSYHPSSLSSPFPPHCPSFHPNLPHPTRQILKQQDCASLQHGPSRLLHKLRHHQPCSCEDAPPCECRPEDGSPPLPAVCLYNNAKHSARTNHWTIQGTSTLTPSHYQYHPLIPSSPHTITPHPSPPHHHLHHHPFIPPSHTIIPHTITPSYHHPHTITLTITLIHHPSHHLNHHPHHHPHTITPHTTSYHHPHHHPLISSRHHSLLPSPLISHSLIPSHHHPSYHHPSSPHTITPSPRHNHHK